MLRLLPRGRISAKCANLPASPRGRISPKCASGSVLMEFLLVCPLLVLLVSAILQFSHIWIAREVTAYAAYCATRAVLSANQTTDDPDDENNEQKRAAQCAAEMACSWMCLAGLSDSEDSPGGSETVELPRFHDIEDIPTTETIINDDGPPLVGEVEIPGLGSIPGSDSVGSDAHKGRVDVSILKSGGSAGVACVAVRFRFPLVFPLVGRMVSWFANSKSGDGDLGRAGTVDYGYHQTEDSNEAWAGEETVMDDEGNLIDRSDVDWGDGGLFPVLVLTEACVLPMPYSGKNLTSVEDYKKHGHVRKYGGVY